MGAQIESVRVLKLWHFEKRGTWAKGGNPTRFCYLGPICAADGMQVPLFSRVITYSFSRTNFELTRNFSLILPSQAHNFCLLTEKVVILWIDFETFFISRK